LACARVCAWGTPRCGSSGQTRTWRRLCSIPVTFGTEAGDPRTTYGD